MATLPKWTDERTDTLTNFVGEESPVSQATVSSAAETLETTTRSVSSKLRKMGYEVELASSTSTRAFTPEQEAILESFVTENSGTYTYAEISDHYQNGAFTAKSIQGKILSMELTGHVKPAPFHNVCMHASLICVLFPPPLSFSVSPLTFSN